MKKYVLNNGLVVLYKKRPSNSVTVQITVRVGSNYEPRNLAGVSHFIEHMLFEGTKTRSAKDIANEIESLGGEINAATSNIRTFYYVVVPFKYFDKALTTLSDIIQNPSFDDRAIEKEKKVLIDEINITKDDPKVYQWVLFLKNLYKKHPCKNPIYGTKDSINNITKKDLLDFYHKYYIPNNMILSVVGNVSYAKEKIERFFTLKKQPLKTLPKVKEPPANSPVSFIEKRNILQSYLTYGFKTTNRIHKDSYTLDVIKAILGRGQSSRLFEEIRTKRGLAYVVLVHHEPSTDYGFFLISVGTDKKNISKIKKIIRREIDNLKLISDKELNDAKRFIEGNFLLENESTRSEADLISSWELIKDASLAGSYLKNIRKINKNNIRKAVAKYFKNPAVVVIQQK